MEFKIILVLTFLLITIFIQTIPVKAISPLHVEGKDIKDDAGCIVYLRGVGKFRFYDDPTGWWATDGQAWYTGNNFFNETVVRQHMNALKNVWGANHIRFHTVADWWLSDYSNYRYNLKRTIEIAGEEGLYVIFDLYSPTSYFTAGAEGNHGTGIAYAPYAHLQAMRDVFPNKQAFVDYWSSVATELQIYPNVIFEIQNEPWVAQEILDAGYTLEAVRNDWFDAVQKCIDAIRSTGASNIIIPTWGLAVSEHTSGWTGEWGVVDMSYFEATWTDGDGVSHTGWTDPLGNLVYTGHSYKTYIWAWGTDYATIKQQMQDNYFIPASQEVPVILGEFGVNLWQSGQALQDELDWAMNIMKISNEYGIGYSAWSWTMDPNPQGEDIWGLLSNQDFPNIHLNQPSEWGQVLIDSIADGGTRICEGTTTTTSTMTTTMVTTTSTTTSTTSTTTTIPVGQVTISGQLMNTTGPVQTDIIVYNQGTSQTNTSDTTNSDGNYSLAVWPDIYDLQYNILNFFIPNFWIKLMSLNIVSDLQGVVNYVTGYPAENITFTVNISTDQEIQVYSEQEPKAVKANGVDMTRVYSVPSSANEWFYDSTEKELYLVVNPSLPTTTTTSTTSTTITTTTTTPTTSTTTIPATTTTSTTTTIPGVEKTFGKTDIGANQAALNANDTYGSRFTLPEDGSVTKISIWMVTGTWHQKIKFAIYDVSAGNPNNLKGASEEILSETGWQWYNATFNPPISLTAGDYYLFVWSTEDWYASQYDTDGTHAYRNINYNGFPDPFGTPDGTGNYNITIYATYTAS